MVTETLGVQGELRQNRVKLSVFRVLAQADSSLGVNELAESAGVNYRSLATRLPLLTRWHYLKRTTGYNYQGRPCFTYTLAAKGRRWLDRHNGHFEDSGDNVSTEPTFEEYLKQRLEAEVKPKILRWYEFNSEVWVELKLEAGRLYFTGLPGEPTQYVCRELLTVNDAPLAWLQIYGDELPKALIREAYQAYRLSLRTGKNSGVEIRQN
jgi:hypothetical protein